VLLDKTINLKKICIRDSQAIPSRVERRRKTVWLISGRLSTCSHCMLCLCRFCLMFLGTELSVAEYDKHVQPTLILVIFCSAVIWRAKFTQGTPEQEDWKKISVEKLQIFLQENFKK
jgi:hypothetical protein